MKVLIKNGTIVPVSDKNVLYNTDIAIEDGIIVAIGDVKNFNSDYTVDATDKIVLPALVNSHTHASMTFFRNFPNKIDSLQSWLSQIWVYEDLLTEEDVYIGTKLAIAEMISSGTTTFSDFYFFQEASSEAIKEAKVKANLGLTLFGDAKESEKRVANTLPSLKKIKQQTNGAIKFDIAPHSIYTCSAGTYKIANEVAKENNCKVHTHISETEKEVSDSLKEFGKRPLQYLDSLGVVDKKHLYLAHGIFLDQSEQDLLKEKKIPLVHNPNSNAILGCGIAPIKKYLENDILIALGTDGASSNNNLDLFLEMRQCGLLSSATTLQARSIDPYEIIKMATINGAIALGRKKEIGTIEVGKEGDLILIDANSVNMLPHNNIYSSLVYSAKSSDVVTVVSGGNIVMENRELKTIDIESVKRDFLESWENIKKRATR